MALDAAIRGEAFAVKIFTVQIGKVVFALLGQWKPAQGKLVLGRRPGCEAQTNDFCPARAMEPFENKNTSSIKVVRFGTIGHRIPDSRAAFDNRKVPGPFQGTPT